MKSFITGFFILLIWFFAGSWIYTCKIKARCTEKPQEKTSVPLAEKVPVKDTIAVEDTIAVKEIVNNNETTAYNKVLYFEFDSERHRKDKAFKLYITNLKTYLNTEPGKTLNIIGHTDNVGEASDNEWIGMQRAKSAMKYLISQGIPKERIQVFSKGETEPLASNSTKEGRRRNRRVEITVN